MITIVLPAFNEGSDLGQLLDDFADAFADEPLDYRIIVVDDGSTDDTAAVARERAQRIPLEIISHPANRGLAEALRTGLITAVRRSGARDIIITMDADHTHPPGLVFRMLRMIREGNDVVVASRYQPGARVCGLPYWRRFLSYAASWSFRILHPIDGIKDYTCGYRAYRAALLRRAFDEQGPEFIDQSGFSCMVDILLKLNQYQPVMNEVPLILHYDLRTGTSKMRVWRTIRETVWLMLRRKFTRTR